jgi:hypothetical protein
MRKNYAVYTGCREGSFSPEILLFFLTDTVTDCRKWPDTNIIFFAFVYQLPG